MSGPTQEQYDFARQRMVGDYVSDPSDVLVDAVAWAIHRAVIEERERAYDAGQERIAVDWHAGYEAGRNSRWNWLFRRVMWLPEPAYYWLLDRLTSNNGWRPLFYRERKP